MGIFKKDKKGFTLVELVVTIGIISLIGSMALPHSISFIDNLKLKSTAYEIQSALQLAQKLSIDESREYAVELTKNSYRIRHFQHGGKIILERSLDSRIKPRSDSHARISYNRDGTTSFGQFILTNGSRAIEIWTLIGTGRVQVIW